jgi:hypothetical protein
MAGLRIAALVLALGILPGCSGFTISQTEAFTCALESDRTDGAIADCYTSRGLAAPF